MKKLFVVAAALAVFAGCKGTDGGSVSDSAAEVSTRVETVSDIAYVDIDSLIAHYDMYIDLSSQFEAKAKKVEGDLTSRKRRLEKEVKDYQEKASNGLLTRSQMAQTEEDLQAKMQSYEQSSQKILAELDEEQQVMTNQVIYAIMSYIKEYNANLRYKMILSTSGSGPVLDADPALNITGEILNELNARYIAEKAKSDKSKK